MGDGVFRTSYPYVPAPLPKKVIIRIRSAAISSGRQKSSLEGYAEDRDEDVGRGKVGDVEVGHVSHGSRGPHDKDDEAVSEDGHEGDKSIAGGKEYDYTCGERGIGAGSDYDASGDDRPFHGAFPLPTLFIAFINLSET